MKVAISTAKGGLADNIFPMFGRSPTLTIVECDEKTKKIGKVEVMPNPGNATGGGAGIVAAQFVAETGAAALITGNCGPNAMGVLTQAGIELYSSSGNVKQAVQNFLENKLQKISTPGRMFAGKGAGGMGAGRGFGQGFGPGRGMGRGFGGRFRGVDL